MIPRPNELDMHKLDCILTNINNATSIVQAVKWRRDLVLLWCHMLFITESNTSLKAKLSKHQNSEFHPDWSMLEATRGALKEQQDENNRLRTVLGEMMSLMDADDIDGLGWCCDVCPRKDVVSSRKHECNFGDCANNFMKVATEEKHGD